MKIKSKNGPYSHPLHFVRRRMDKMVTEKNVDKVRVAKLVCQETASLDILDLRERISELVTMIEAANL